MTALTNDRNTPYKDADLVSLPMAAAAKIYSGAITVLAAGFAKQGVTATGLVFVGRAEEFVDNSAGNNGDRTVLVRRKKAFKWVNSGSDPIAQADVGATCYIVDDQTVAKTSNTGARSAAGTILGVDTDGVWVE